ncbi:class I SAM-dependent methyltransferase [uncultured Pseudodesulfovibrio sp.]|uniref:class I SAM-dependent methyltransferase n=1 Tax=uncultured Pseudodesulfovibrio sp. TaxID=2035858 RepID=UPI0029C7B262|nr:class I SAM-dependent methyltransferase [uncultured Pseudodesulfovibrio sp.]
MKARNHDINSAENDEMRHGPTSYVEQNSGFVFDKIGLLPGHAFLDLGCGRGDYSLHASEIVGDDGVVLAVDKYDYITDDLAKWLKIHGVGNVRTMAADMTERLDVGEVAFDSCMAATALYLLDLEKYGVHVFKKVRRLLKPGGVFAVIEFSMKDISYGPPLKARVAPEEFEALALEVGFAESELHYLGNQYLMLFRAPVA